MSAVEVAEGIGRVVVLVAESDGFAAAAQASAEGAEDGDAGVLGGEGGGVI